MHNQSLGRQIEDVRQHIVDLQQQANTAFPEYRARLTDAFATIASALDELRRVTATQSQPLVSATKPHTYRAAAMTEIGDDTTPLHGHEERIAEATAVLYQVDSQNPATDSARQSEAALRYQYQITQTITDNATACLFMMDAQGCCIFMNPAAEQVTGYTFHELTGQILHDKIHHTHPDGTPYPMSECPIDRALPQNNQIRAHEDIFIRKDGTFFPVVCAASPIIKDGVPVGTVIEVRDVTESKAAEEERARLFEAERRAVRKAQQQAEQLRGLTAASIAINAALSVDEVLQLITDQARQLIGAHQGVSSLTTTNNEAQAISAVSLSESYAARRDDAVPTNGSRISTEICRTNHPMRMTQSELEAHPAWPGCSAEADAHPPRRGWVAAPLIGRDGRNIGVLHLSDKYEGDFTTEDESILVQLAQMASVALENARLYTAAQDAIRARNEFLSVASHELNTPVTSLRGYSQLLIRQLERGQALTTERLQRALRAIDQQSTKLGQLINQLLDISRIESGRLILDCQPVEITQMVGDVAANLQTTTARHTLTVYAPEPIIASVDPLRIEQVLTNLLSNAIKYSPEGGPIQINILRAAPEQVTISVTDCGIGIPPEHRPHIFNRFYQAHDSGTFGGMGLGLSISQQIVALHRGHLVAEFPPDGGTRFIVKLPLG